ncbi:MAG: UDP-3-O-(3-hydroxymyristoyl)glucosamine N-acyltransferase [Paludibacteraceae bacterium]|nr:UDP-3-O-(3-hydroxymyristoyl)glucosamine N-acyltransferase [Paludibacteraceae bacterium]
MLQFSANQIAQAVGGEVVGNGNAMANNFAKIEEAQDGALCFVMDSKYAHYLADTKASVVLINRDVEFSGSTSATLIRVDNARASMAQLLTMVEETINPRRRGVEQPSFVTEGVEVPDDSYIGAFAYIGKNVRIGKGVQIYPHCYIGDNVRIGDNTILYDGVKVYYNSQIGQSCVLHAGVVVGSDGFGFEPDANGVYHKVPQIGDVIIEDDVEIGANTTIDRAMMGHTIVHRNTKIDNLVQVAHNCVVGESTVLCAQVGLAGSTTVGKHCILTGQVGVAGHLEIADNVIIGAQGGVANSIKKQGIYQGSPVLDVLTFRKNSVIMKQLPELRQMVMEHERKLKSINKE